MTNEELLDSIKSIVSDAEQRIARNTTVLMEAEFKPKFDLLAEGQQTILNRMPNKS